MHVGKKGSHTSRKHAVVTQGSHACIGGRVANNRILTCPPHKVRLSPLSPHLPPPPPPPPQIVDICPHFEQQNWDMKANESI